MAASILKKLGEGVVVGTVPMCGGPEPVGVWCWGGKEGWEGRKWMLGANDWANGLKDTYMHVLLPTYKTSRGGPASGIRGREAGLQARNPSRSSGMLCVRMWCGETQGQVAAKLGTRPQS